MLKDTSKAEQELSGSLTRRNLFAAATGLVSAIAATKLGTTRASAGPGGTVGGGGVQCYLAGTLIFTPEGPRDVSSLKIGDSVVSYSGKAKPIKWIGRNRFTRRSHENWPTNVMPIKVARFALDGQTPSADLYLSAGHGIYLDGMLVQVGSLINGETITRASAAHCEVLEYFQIELADHDVIFAEGAATETLLPSADHQLFDNWQEYEALYGAEPVSEARMFASEIHLSGRRAQLRSRFRSAFSPWIDRRQPFDVVRDRLEQRAAFLNTAA
jgi:hypothetical protein